jgi:hypothetical protein
MLDISDVAGQITAALVPYFLSLRDGAASVVKAAGKRVLEKAGKSAEDAVLRMTDRLFQKLYSVLSRHPSAMAAMRQLQTDPTDGALRSSLSAELRSVLEKDGALLTELRTLLMPPQINQNIAKSKSGFAIAAQKIVKSKFTSRS